MSTFGTFQDSPKPYALNGQPGWYAVPAGRNWYSMIDSGMQQWVSPNPLTRETNGSVTGSPLYAAELNQDGTLVFQETMASRKLGIDAPAHDRLSPFY